ETAPLVSFTTLTPSRETRCTSAGGASVAPRFCHSESGMALAVTRVAWSALGLADGSEPWKGPEHAEPRNSTAPAMAMQRHGPGPPSPCRTTLRLWCHGGRTDCTGRGGRDAKRTQHRGGPIAVPSCSQSQEQRHGLPG